MERIIKTDITVEEEQQFSQLIEEYLTKIRQINEAMAKDQIEIKQLQAETRAILSRNWEAA